VQQITKLGQWSTSVYSHKSKIHKNRGSSLLSVVQTHVQLTAILTIFLQYVTFILKQKFLFYSLVKYRFFVSTLVESFKYFIDLASSAKLPNWLYILPSVISFFFIFLMTSRRQIISRSAGPIFAIFSPNESVFGADDRSGFLFWYLKGRRHGNQLVVFYGPIYFVALPFGKGLQYRNSDFKRLDRMNMNISTSCAILVTFRPETSEFTLLTIAPFVAIRQKSAYHAKYIRMFWTYLDLLYRFGRRISGDDFPNIRFAAAQGTLIWQSVKNGSRSQTSRRTTFTLCFGIRQQIDQS